MPAVVDTEEERMMTAFNVPVEGIDQELEGKLQILRREIEGFGRLSVSL